MEMASKKIACVVLMCMVMMAFSPSAEALTCAQVSKAMAPCIGYLTKNAPLGNCCPGVKTLASQANTPADRRTACNCLKSLAGSLTGLNLSKAANLPGTCGVKIPYKISPSTDCNSVN